MAVWEKIIKRKFGEVALFRQEIETGMNHGFLNFAAVFIATLIDTEGGGSQTGSISWRSSHKF